MVKTYSKPISSINTDLDLNVTMWISQSCSYRIKKAQIKAPLSFVTVLTSTQRVAYLEPKADAVNRTESELPEAWLKPPRFDQKRDNEAIAFQVACMQRLDEAARTEK